MPLSREKKSQIVEELSGLLDSSKLTVFAEYSGTPVKALQRLRAQSRASGTTVKVVKNRLFWVALAGSSKFGSVDMSVFSGQLIYAFNQKDELAPAQELARFARTEPQIKLSGALAHDGTLLSSSEVTELANLPTMGQLRSQLVGLLEMPAGGVVRVLAANLRSTLNALNAKAEA